MIIKKKKKRNKEKKQIREKVGCLIYSINLTSIIIYI